jgi:hypothetical protein
MEIRKVVSTTIFFEEEEEYARTNTTWDNTFSSSEAYISDDD